MGLMLELCYTITDININVTFVIRELHINRHKRKLHADIIIKSMRSIIITPQPPPAC